MEFFENRYCIVVECDENLEMFIEEKGINKGIVKLNYVYVVMIFKKMLLYCIEENFILDMVMIEKCVEEI